MQLRGPHASERGDSREAEPEAAPPDGGAFARISPRAVVSLAASLLLHGVLLAVLALFAPQMRLAPTPPVEAVSVQILSPQQFAALTPPPAPTEDLRAAPGPEPAVPPQPPETQPPMTHAARILSTALAAHIRRDLRTLALDTRFEQICDVEAMEQVAKSRKELRPERAVAYATADVKMSGNVMTAEGAAFLSRGQWYEPRASAARPRRIASR